MAHVNVMRRYPRAERNLDERKANITEELRSVARKFGEEFFDGDRLHGYGGYRYDGRWVPVVEDFCNDYGLSDSSAVLDVGCAKGFMVQDFISALPGSTIKGVDVSDYAIGAAEQHLRPHLQVADAKDLPFESDSFDLVISINTIHNLELAECKQSLNEISRVSRQNAFIVVDSWHSEAERRRMEAWNLTALTYMSAPEWECLFKEVGYRGDWDWFIP